jgi:hypothetical protein
MFIFPQELITIDSGVYSSPGWGLYTSGYQDVLMSPCEAGDKNLSVMKKKVTCCNAVLSY